MFAYESAEPSGRSRVSRAEWGRTMLHAADISYRLTRSFSLAMRQRPAGMNLYLGHVRARWCRVCPLGDVQQRAGVYESWNPALPVRQQLRAAQLDGTSQSAAVCRAVLVVLLMGGGTQDAE